MTSGRVVRISSDLDKAIRDMAIKNNMKYQEASRELAKLSLRIKNRGRIFKEIRF